MRTTVTLDKDVENLLRLAMRERGASFKAVLNDAIREGLRGAPSRKAEPYRPIMFDMGRPLVDLTKALSLAQELEDQETMRKHWSRRCRSSPIGSISRAPSPCIRPRSIAR